jgi:hypothetical protein
MMGAGPQFVPIYYPGYGPLTAGQVQTTEPSLTLIDGSVISNPSSTQPTGNQCLAYQCGADPTNTAALEWCSFWNQAAALPCSDPQCDPVRALLNCTPPIVAPSHPAGPPVIPALPGVPTLTPLSITQPLPDITATLGPVPVSDPWCEFNTWLNANPLLAVGILAGTAFVLWPRRGRA